MNLKKFLDAIEAAAGTLAPVFPPATIVAIGAELAETIVNAFQREGTSVVDEDGNTVTADELRARIQATWDKGLAAAREGSSKAQGEIDRTV